MGWGLRVALDFSEREGTWNMVIVLIYRLWWFERDCDWGDSFFVSVFKSVRQRSFIAHFWVPSSLCVFFGGGDNHDHLCVQTLVFFVESGDAIRPSCPLSRVVAIAFVFR